MFILWGKAFDKWSWSRAFIWTQNISTWPCDNSYQDIPLNTNKCHEVYLSSFIYSCNLVSAGIGLYHRRCNKSASPGASLFFILARLRETGREEGEGQEQKHGNSLYVEVCLDLICGLKIRSHGYQREASTEDKYPPAVGVNHSEPRDPPRWDLSGRRANVT